MNSRPLVSVIIPVYNSESYLRECLHSIVNQTYDNIEVLVLDDGSKDSSVSIVQSFSDKRIQLFVTPKNSGIVFQLNKGLSLSRGKYIARMDSDDIACLTRLEKQVDFMESNLEIGVCGTWLETFGNGYPEKWELPLTHEEISTRMFFGNCLFHPTVILRANSFDCYYSDNYLYAEDYELWTRLQANGVRFANIPDYLLKYRLHGQQTSAASRAVQQKSAEKILARQLSRINCCNPRAMKFHKVLNDQEIENDLFLEFTSWLNKIITNNHILRVFPEDILRESIFKVWRELSIKHISSVKGLLAFNSSILKWQLSSSERCRMVYTGVKNLILSSYRRTKYSKFYLGRPS